MKKKLAILGLSGKVGQTFPPLVKEDSLFTLVPDPLKNNNWEKIDMIIDFSSPETLEVSIPFVLRYQIPWVLGTTGFSPFQLQKLETVKETIPLFLSANFSLGITLLHCLVKNAAKFYPESKKQIVETHHIHKKDQPSGTALSLKSSLEEATIQSFRIGEIVGTHEVLFATEEETLSLKHIAHSKKVFAKGALKAAHFLLGKPAGLYTMQDLFINEQFESCNP